MADSPVYWVDYKNPLFDKEIYQFDYHPDFENNIFPLGKVNIFVGANNSGKSRALRALFALEHFKIVAQDSKINYQKLKGAFSEGNYIPVYTRPKEEMETIKELKKALNAIIDYTTQHGIQDVHLKEIRGIALDAIALAGSQLNEVPPGQLVTT